MTGGTVPQATQSQEEPRVEVFVPQATDGGIVETDRMKDLPSTPGTGWQTVGSKNKVFSPVSGVSNASPPPLNTFKNLAMVDEIDAKRATDANVSPEKKLSKSQRKERKQALGKASPQLS